MRKILLALTAASAVAFIAPAMAQSKRDYNPYAPAAVGTGVVAGTAAGVSQYNGWWGNRWFGNTTLGSGLERTVAGSLATGFVTGVATVALIDASTQPCRGFRALFAPFRGVGHERGCRGGEWVG
jgi:hypothetical protein